MFELRAENVRSVRSNTHPPTHMWCVSVCVCLMVDWTPILQYMCVYIVSMGITFCIKTRCLCVMNFKLVILFLYGSNVARAGYRLFLFGVGVCSDFNMIIAVLMLLFIILVYMQYIYICISYT